MTWAITWEPIALSITYDRLAVVSIIYIKDSTYHKRYDLIQAVRYILLLLHFQVKYSVHR